MPIKNQHNSSTEKQKVIFDHDGGVDDLLSLILLLTMDHIDLLAVTITPADCYLSDATTSTLKILSMFNRTDVPVGKGILHGENAFPADWRAQPKICNVLPDMLAQSFDQNQVSELSADELINACLSNAENVSVLMTGPSTNLVAALEKQPQLKAKIKDVIWMGGAVDVAGNVAMYNHDKSAEWNAYWDPVASQKLFASGLVVKLIGLDATNCLPVNIDFLSQLAEQKQYPISNIACQFWATTINTIPSYEFTYFMWDVLATCVLALQGDEIEFQPVKLNVATSEPNAGQTYRDPEQGFDIDVAFNVDKDAVLNYILKQFRC
ncbi:MAG: nucleoside hydrolase [Aliiglaciecola sp.]|uniref:nucleoside hydrolase n=1 Tax=Aliiglaciecola sp. TaxID=1872441 RepID=UPI003296C098